MHLKDNVITVNTVIVKYTETKFNHVANMK